MSAHDTTTVLDVRDLCTKLGGRSVLENLNLEISAGSFVGLVGPNGAGKTTLLRSILELIPCRGKVTLQAEVGVGYVPQKHEFAWDFPISVEDTVLTGKRFKLWQRPTVEDYKAVNNALKQVHLSEVKDRPVAELSGGQKQRVLVARALVSHPQLLVLDEPFTGVDVPTQELLTDLFISLAKEGTVVLMATHDLVAAMHTCTHIAMLKGNIRAYDSPHNLTDPQLWCDVFSLKPQSPLLTALGVSA